MILFYKNLPAFFVLMVFLCSGKSYGQQKEDVPQTVEALQGAIEKVLKETQTPAAGIALVQGDSIVWVAGLGKANIEKDIEATENTMFRIGSVSKMFVSLAILKLQEEGRVNLTDKVEDLVPEIEFTNPWRKTAPVLVEHLLEHTTGWDDLHLTEYALNDSTLSLKQGIDYHPHSRISRWMPGTRMSYCNSGPPVAAYIIEKITGQQFEEYIQEQFFKPMGMANATYFASESYQKLGAALYIDKQPQKYWNIIVRPSGAINASPKDMTGMLRFFINRGRVDSLQIISEASLKRMETPATSTGAKAGLEYGYGLANYSTPHKSFVYRSHNGGVNGGLTDFSYLPTHKVGYVVMINSGNGSALYRISDLIRNFQTRDLKSDKVTIVKADSTVWHNTDISGYYVPINPRVQMAYHFERLFSVKHIWHKNEFTFIQSIFGGWSETHVTANNTQFVSAETGKISMVRVQDPLAGEVVHTGSQVLIRISPLLAFGQLALGAVWVMYMVVSIFLGLVWGIRYRENKALHKGNMRLVVWPCLASIFFLAVLILEFVGAKDIFELLGKISFVSVAIMILTICFALASLLSVVVIIKNASTKVNRNLYWHLAILSGLHLLATVYLLWYDVIGIRTWS